MKLVIYKAVFPPPGARDYDRLHPPLCPPEDGVEFVCFRDVAEDHLPHWEQGWRILPQQFHDADPRARVRHHKCRADLLFPDADFTLWLDGNLTPRISPVDIVGIHGQTAPVVTFQHARECAYQEAAIRMAKGTEHPAVIEAQMARYRARGYPDHAGLCATSAVLRAKTPAVSRFNEAWWEEVQGSLDDELSINYVLWSQGLAWAALPGHPKRSTLFVHRRHDAAD